MKKLILYLSFKNFFSVIIHINGIKINNSHPNFIEIMKKINNNQKENSKTPKEIISKSSNFHISKEKTIINQNKSNNINIISNNIEQYKSKIKKNIILVNGNVKNLEVYPLIKKTKKIIKKNTK